MEDLDRLDQAARDRRGGGGQPVGGGELTYQQAASLLGLSITRALVVRNAWRAGGVQAIPVPRRRRPPPPSESPLVRYRLESRLADPDNRRLYRRRSHLAEAPFAQIKHRRGLRQFVRRGLQAVNAELLLDCLVHNLLRIRQATAGLLPCPA